MATRKTSADYIREFQAAHGGRYDYSKTQYVNAVTNLQVGCPVHGDFWQTPANHLRGNGCPKCSHEARWANTFKEKCKALGIDYWRALKRREAGMSDEKILEAAYVRGDRQTASSLTAYGVSYPNIEAACKVLLPTANSSTIRRWISDGMAPEEAFERIPNPESRLRCRGNLLGDARCKRQAVCRPDDTDAGAPLDLSP